MLSLILIIFLFLIYDYFFTHYYNKNAPSPIKTEVAKKVGISINKSAFTSNNSQVKSYIDGAEAFPAMEKLINSAKETLFIETFIFHYDPTGLRIANLLANKKKQGIDVKVIIDSTGLKFAKDDYKIVDFLKNKKIDTQIFNSKFISKTGLNITHRKMILVDGYKVMVGGMNFGKEYQYTWHDSMFEMNGQVAQEIQKEFLYDWKRSGGALPKKILKLKDQKFGNTRMKVITTNVTPDNKLHDIHSDMIKIIDNTKNTLKVISPYFSDDEVIGAIERAKKRKVKVTIIMPQHNNHSVFRDLNLYTAKKFLADNIDTYFYKPRFSHLKALISDDKTSIVGSANIDERSFTGNQELCVIIEDKDFVQTLDQRVFLKDIKQSEKANEENTKLSIPRKTIIKTLEALDYYL